MRAAAALGACLFVLGVSGSQPLAQQREPESPDHGNIAVLRRDGLIIPFASFRGTRWQTPWPVNLRNLELPVNLASIPERWWGGDAPAGWQAWPLGGTPRPLKPTAPQIFPIHCAQRIGLRTDYTTAGDAPRVQVEPYPKDGIAATAGVRVERVQTVGDDNPAWSALAVSLLEDFGRAEDREISMLSSVFSHPVDQEERQKIPVRLETWYLETLEDGSAISYIEAARRYPPGPDDEGCGLETFFSGWVKLEKGKKPATELQARVTYCDRVGVAFMQPLGKIRLRDRTYWIAQIAGPESEWYIVAEIASRGVQYVAEYFAGSRESCRGPAISPAPSPSPSPSPPAPSR